MEKLIPSRKLIYLDNAATTPIDRAVLRAMQPYLTEQYGNPSSLYRIGQQAKEAVDKARKVIADVLQAQPREIIFTAGGTESVNLAILGVAHEYELKNKKKGHIITSAIEHHAVLHTVGALKKEGWAVTLVDSDKNGLVSVDSIRKAIRKDTILVSIMYANNEVGTIQNIPDIGKLVAGVNRARVGKKLPRIYFHSDACQAGNSLDLNIFKLGVDLLSVNGSKIYGPKQIGFLYVRSGTPLRPIIFGGGQERNMRSGTENVAGVVGLAKALELAQKTRLQENSRIKKLRDTFLTQLLKSVSGVTLNGPDDRKIKLDKHKFNEGMQRLPNNVNVSVKGIEGEVLLFYLDGYNIAVSTGSACSSSSPDPSHVILGLGKKKADAFSSLRITLGKQTTKNELDYVLKVIKAIVKQERGLK